MTDNILFLSSKEVLLLIRTFFSTWVFGSRTMNQEMGLLKFLARPTAWLYNTAHAADTNIERMSPLGVRPLPRTANGAGRKRGAARADSARCRHPRCTPAACPVQGAWS